jgi:hypothetical protein
MAKTIKVSITVDAWDNLAKQIGQTETEKLLGKRPELSFSEMVERFDGTKQIEIMSALVNVYKVFNHPLRDKLSYVMNMSRKHWTVKGKQKPAIEGEVFKREWETVPAPTDSELQANWISASNATKCTFYRIYRELGTFMPQTESLTPVKPLN